jgi:serine/threonine protein kinase
MADEQVIPKEIGGYIITGILGEGGMSIVYTALQNHPKRVVAIKVLRGGLYSPTASKRFHLEVEILGKLDHPWIAKIYDAGTHDDGNGATPYYVMEHVEGARELTQYLEDEELQRRDVLKLFTMITSAVEHGHHRGIVHRDLKPGNILIDSKGEPKIIDFGVARSLDSDKVQAEAMTEAGRLVGTVQFMAPEQVDAKISDVDARCDVYALGAVLYQMLTKRLPRTLEGLPIYEAVRQICIEDPVLPTVYEDTIDQDLEAIIMKALENNREKRYQTAGAFGRDMLRYLGDKPIKARKVTVLDRTRLFCRRHKKQLLIWSTVLVVGILATSVAWYVKNTSDRRQQELQTTIEELSKKNEELAIIPPATDQPTTPSKFVTEPFFTLPVTPTAIQVSADGSTIVAVIDDNFIAFDSNGTQLPLPPMNVEPIEAKFALSPSGSRAVFVSVNSYSVSLNTQPPRKEQFSVPYDATTLAVSQHVVAVLTSGGGLPLLVDGEWKKPAIATTGAFEVVAQVISGAQGNKILAATEDWFYIWGINDFPRNTKKIRGVSSPCFIGGFQEVSVLVGRNGQLVIHTPTIVHQKVLIPSDATIDACALNTEATLLVYISEGKAFLYNFESDETEELDWMQEYAIGACVNAQNQVLLWTTEGAFYRENREQ